MFNAQPTTVAGMLFVGVFLLLVAGDNSPRHSLPLFLLLLLFLHLLLFLQLLLLLLLSVLLACILAWLVLGPSCGNARKHSERKSVV